MTFGYPDNQSLFTYSGLIQKEISICVVFA